MSDTKHLSLSLTSFQIKCLACLFMLIDHAGVTLVPISSPCYIYFRMMGRLAFPLFAYMLATGYRHSRDLRKYLLRLTVFALLMQAVYVLVMDGDDINIFATLALGLITIIGWEKLKGERKWSVSGVLLVIAAAAVGQLLKFDYGAYGILLIFSCHLFYDDLGWLALIWTGLALGARQLHWVGSSQLLAVCALVIIGLYNGRPGPRGFGAKWGFYLFYCLHLPLLYGISLLV